MTAYSGTLRISLLAGLLALPLSATALNSVDIVSSVASLDCLAYRIVGLCFWLFCTDVECTVRVSPKIRHYMPDAVVSSYANTGENSWQELRVLSPANPTAKGGGNATSGDSHENALATFKNADVIGHPGGWLLSEFAGEFGYVCPGAGIAFMPYFLSTFDTLGWRYNIPEKVFPEALLAQRRNIGSRANENLWGAVYPRGGFLHQVDDYKAGAVVAQRVADIVTRRGQIHVYQPLLAKAKDGYWPAGAVVEGDARTGKWQELAPERSSSCVVFPNNHRHKQAQRGDYAWALWRPYTCCERRGQVFLGSIDFPEPAQ